MTQIHEATPTQIHFAQARAARLARWAVAAKPEPRAVVRQAAAEVEPSPPVAPKRTPSPWYQREVWPPYMPMAPYDVCLGAAVAVPPHAKGRDLGIGIARKHGLTFEQLCGPQRSNGMVAARQEAFYVIHRDTPLSLTQIGKLMGGKDHTTVYYGICRHKQALSMGFSNTGELRSATVSAKSKTIHAARYAGQPRGTR